MYSTYGCAASFLVHVWIMVEAVPHDCTRGARPALVTHEYLLDSRFQNYIPGFTVSPGQLLVLLLACRYRQRCQYLCYVGPVISVIDPLGANEMPYKILEINNIHSMNSHESN